MMQNSTGYNGATIHSVNTVDGVVNWSIYKRYSYNQSWNAISYINSGGIPYIFTCGQDLHNYYT